MARQFKNQKVYSRSYGAGSCYFISHRKCHVKTAQALAKLIYDLGAKVYLDELDQDLQVAVSDSDDNAIADQIDTGLRECTHLIGIIGNQTKKSWWVPYEIGASRLTNGKKNNAFVILEGVDKLPSYIRTSTALKDRKEIVDWIASDTPIRLDEKRAAKRKQIPDVPRRRRTSIRYSS